MVSPFEDNQTDDGILAIRNVVGLLEFQKDEGIYAASPALSTVHARALLTMCFFLVLEEGGVLDKKIII